MYNYHVSSFVYWVRNLLDGKAYIGVSKNDLHRLDEHRKGIKSNRRLQSAIKKHGIENFVFEQLQEWPTCEEALDAERVLIALCRDSGTTLYNLVDGGRGSLNPSDETRQRMRTAKLGPRNHRFGVKDNEETKQRRNASVSSALTGRTRGPNTPEWNDRIRQGNLGKKHKPLTEESRRKKSERMKGKPTPMAGLPPWNKGRKMEPQSEEQRRAKSERQRGTKRSEETRARMRVSAQLREARKRFRAKAHARLRS